MVTVRSRALHPTVVIHRSCTLLNLLSLAPMAHCASHSVVDLPRSTVQIHHSTIDHSTFSRLTPSLHVIATCTPRTFSVSVTISLVFSCFLMFFVRLLHAFALCLIIPPPEHSVIIFRDFSPVLRLHGYFPRPQCVLASSIIHVHGFLHNCCFAGLLEVKASMFQSYHLNGEFCRQNCRNLLNNEDLSTEIILITY